jgi:hypothetical protein
MLLEFQNAKGITCIFLIEETILWIEIAIGTFHYTRETESILETSLHQEGIIVVVRPLTYFLLVD